MAGMRVPGAWFIAEGGKKRDEGGFVDFVF
jgi:hypothetical protein